MIRKLGFLLAIVISLPAYAGQDYINLFGSWVAHNQESMEDSKTRPTGIAYGAGLGTRKDFFEVELDVSKGEYVASINHDNTPNKIVHDQLQVTLALNFYLLKTVYIRGGYAFTKFKQETKTPVSGASGEGLKESYGLKEDKLDGMVLGGGYVITPTGGMNIYVQYDYYNIPQLKATQHVFTAGLRWYFSN